MNIFLTSPISFPGLGIEGINPPDGFSIPGTNFEIKFYGVIIAIGVLLAVTYCLRRAKQFGVTQDDILNLVLICLPSAIVGARLYYVIFEWDQFFGPGIPWYRFLDIRSGGLAIYGGVIGAVLGMLIYTRVRKLKIFPFLDLTGIGLLLGQAIGRWGNFFNREAHGGVTTCFLRMGLVENGELQYFHPTFLYESVWNLTGFVVLHFLSKKRKFDGQMFLAYLAWYGAGRMVIEGLRTDSLWLGPVRVSQLLAAVTMLLSLGILLYQAIFVRHDPAKMQVNRVAAAEAAAATAAEVQPEETAEPEDAASEPEDEVSEETESSEESKGVIFYEGNHGNPEVQGRPRCGRRSPDRASRRADLQEEVCHSGGAGQDPPLLHAAW